MADWTIRINWTRGLRGYYLDGDLSTQYAALNTAATPFRTHVQFPWAELTPLGSEVGMDRAEAGSAGLIRQILVGD